MNPSPPGRPRSLLWWEITTAAVLGTVAFAATGMAIVWVISGIAAGWSVCRSMRWAGRRAEPSHRVRTLGQAMVGAALGPALAVQDFAGTAAHLPAVFLGLLLILVGSVIIARLYARWTGTDRLTAGLATLPGGLAIMPSVAVEHGRPPTLIAMIQASRLTVVICAVPLLAPFLGEVNEAPVTELLHLPTGIGGWVFWIVLLVLAPLAAMAGRRLRVPVPALLGPMFAAIVFTVALRVGGVDVAFLQVPFLQEVVGQVFLGLTVGEYLAQRARHSARQILGGLLGVAGTFVLALVLAAVMTPLTPWSFMTCLLVVAPGGAPEMVVVAAAVDADLHVVVLAQTVRQVAVNALMPFWIWLFDREPPSAGSKR
ncbi:MAG TPA: AbrB family transcriptional regulator [Nocardiopsis listeri]|uniref:AbrB family transcriptional regulator n=1 Tax=Nocardiopsis listeri TaxID=53440 RepID=UPI001DABE8D7|nr:AbrB family transcriptional regulator [Nocardiopsis listeri]HJE57271.1 AbrB family transcriptional regulator [Nocardiopsis listeri]